MKEGEREGRKETFPSFNPHLLPALLLAPFFARSLTLVPRSLLIHRTETLATQATQTSFRGEASGGFAECRLFSQAICICVRFMFFPTCDHFKVIR